MSEEKTRGGDPLSMVLIGAVVLLGVMYVLDERGRSQLQGMEQAAQEIGASKLSGCKVSAAGARGERLLAQCEGSARAQTEGQGARLGDAALAAGFTDVAWRGTQETVVCPAQTSGWPQACADPVVLPTREELKAKQRRSKAQE